MKVRRNSWFSKISNYGKPIGSVDLFNNSVINLLSTYLSAYKQKVCPIIEYVDD